ncbi:RES family NAD+ phosphorylase [Arenimonas sp. MALMAid1274]|uniref:RES family NAD+ phosphorylase n=1 Tax=Arenimonas sp. MALMAid1274 TaxID=3411630 RepID=UPI003B9FDA12
MAVNKPPRRTLVRWPEAWRIVPSRFPPRGVFDRIASPDDLEALYAIEAMTNARLRQELGQLDLVPRERRISGPGTQPVMAAFTHLNPDGSRFSDGSYGVFYAARTLDTAIAETMYHRGRFMAATREPAMKLDMRCYRTSIEGRLHDLRKGWAAMLRPDDYRAPQALARELRAAGSDGVVYPSVRHAGGECVGVFFPDLVKPCVQAQHLIYSWDGERMQAEYAVATLHKAP